MLGRLGYSAMAVLAYVGLIVVMVYTHPVGAIGQITAGLLLVTFTTVAVVSTAAAAGLK